MKILLLVLTAFVMPISYAIRGTDFYVDKINSAYEEYVVSVDESNDNYTLCIVTGIANEKPAYGIFYETSQNNLMLVCQMQNEIYEYETSTDGSIWLIGVEYTYEANIILYNKTDKTSTNKLIVNDEVFEQKMIKGLNSGCEFSKVKSLNDQFITQTVIYIVLGIVITTCIVILSVFRVTHSGLFSKQKRQRTTTFNMKEFLQEIPEELDPYDPIKEVEVEEFKEDAVDVVTISPKEYLQEKGYIVDYSLLSEDEKNKIMVELMILKNEGKIKEEEYKKETVELWKK